MVPNPAPIVHSNKSNIISTKLIRKLKSFTFWFKNEMYYSIVKDEVWLKWSLLFGFEIF